MPNRITCSNCRSPISPIVAVDIDGTLGNYHEHFTKFAEGYFGHRLPRGYIGQGTFWEYLGLTLEDYRAAKLAYRQGGTKRTMPLFPGAKDLMTTLLAEGAEIWIATTRPYLRLDNVDPDTREWLRRNEIQYHHMIYGDDKYDQLRKIADDSGREVIGVVDDLPEQYQLAESFDLNPFLVTRNHNSWPRYEAETSENGASFNTSTLQVAASIFSDRLREWKARSSE